MFTGPCPIYEAGTHLVQLGLMLPMYKHYAEGNVPGEDYLWRQYEHFHPPAVPVGIDPCYVVSQEYRNGAEDGIAYHRRLRDANRNRTLSSSGGAVTYDVTNLTEGRLDDNNGDFSWSSGDPFNGATQASTDAQRHRQGRRLRLERCEQILRVGRRAGPAELRDLEVPRRPRRQGTQHPYTMATNGILTFTITLRDGAGNTSSINTGAYGGGFGMPYARSGGWHNEMRRIRIRTTDFLANGSGLDLTNIVAVRLNFGPSWGTNQGRIVIDELMLDNDLPPFFIPMTMSLVAPAPEFMPAARADDDERGDRRGQRHARGRLGHVVLPLRRRRLDSPPLQQVAGELWRGTLPAPQCGERRSTTSWPKAT